MKPETANAPAIIELGSATTQTKGGTGLYVEEHLMFDLTAGLAAD